MIIYRRNSTQAIIRNPIESGTRVETIAVANVLAVLNWPESSERYRRLARFVSAFFSRYDSSLMHDHRSKWDEGIPSARVPGWQRFRIPAQQWLDRKALAPSPSGAIATSLMRARHSPAERLRCH